jgi:hypothetical protein
VIARDRDERRAQADDPRHQSVRLGVRAALPEIAGEENRPTCEQPT